MIINRPCPNPSSEACGGPLDEDTEEPSALSLYDVQPPMYIVDFPNWFVISHIPLSHPPLTPSSRKYSGCLEHFSTLNPLNFTHVATITELTVEGCLNACDHTGLSNTMAALSGMSCYCSAAKPDNLAFTSDGVCSAACPGQVNQACGTPYLLPLFQSFPPLSSSLYSLLTLIVW
jgi:hypothetical protein